MDEPSVSNLTEENKPKIKWDKNKILWILLLLLIIIILSVVAFYSGYKSGLTKTQNDKEKQIAILQSDIKRLKEKEKTEIEKSKVPEISEFEKDKNRNMLEICGENWDDKVNPLRRVECMTFDGNGYISKTLQGKIIGQNYNIPDSKKTEIANVVNSFYDELQTEKYEKLLTSYSIIPPGGMAESITTFSYSKYVKRSSSRSINTTFIWGTNYDPESRRLMEMFKTLKEYDETITNINSL